MIIVRIHGGLGNQMFQYATARSLSEINKDELMLDISSFKHPEGPDIFREYMLDRFNIESVLSKEGDLNVLDKGWIFKIKDIVNRKFFRKFYIEFDESILNKKGNVYLNGFFQSEKYFIKIRDVLLKEFTLRDGLSGNSKFYFDKIKSDDKSVSIHIRRGDYVHNLKTNKYHGLCPISYYESAIKKLEEKGITNPNLYIFTDDPVWARENFKISYPYEILSGHEIPEFEELILMSLCRHNIIANSSFSWWGAWLNVNPEKIVVAPLNWFRNKKIKSEDVIPDTWIRL